MWVVLCHEEDEAGLWAYRGLQQRLSPVALVTPRDVTDRARLVYRAGRHAQVLVEPFERAALRSGDVTGGLNRLHGPDARTLRRFVDADREYVQQEYAAVLLGCLQALSSNLINQPTSFGLAGRWRPPSEWTWLAGRCGLPTPPYVEGSGEREPPPGCHAAVDATTAFVIDGECLSGCPMPGAIREGSLKLAAMAETRLIGIDFICDGGGDWRFAGASATPELRAGGEALLDLLAHKLAGAAG